MGINVEEGEGKQCLAFVYIYTAAHLQHRKRVGFPSFSQFFSQISPNHAVLQRAFAL